MITKKGWLFVALSGVILTVLVTSTVVLARTAYSTSYPPQRNNTINGISLMGRSSVTNSGDFWTMYTNQTASSSIGTIGYDWRSTREFCGSTVVSYPMPGYVNYGSTGFIHTYYSNFQLVNCGSEYYINGSAQHVFKINATTEWSPHPITEAEIKIR